ncbi:acyl-CoA synthetase FdrA [Coriobacteriales bacterium OH1046]|nr:acyl-CoA synthetase FdrA [Coriobacteriales bacterium OH1046]
MLRTVIKKNSYQDSINLMLLTNEVNALAGVNKSQIMMGTDANKDIFRNSGLLTAEAEAADPSDMVLVVDTDDEEIIGKVLGIAEKFLSDLSTKKEASGIQEATTWEEAYAMLPDADLALFSTPGEYTAPEIEKALNHGLHVFSFSDNVSLEDEVRLKKLAHEKGLMLMGPDCGTGVISSIPVAFTNVSKPGNIGIVGASGTGIQEVAAIIDRLGGGLIHAIGTGGRDLNEAVGAITVKDAIIGLENHEPTDVICVISKPPAPAVRDEVVDLLEKCTKPVVAIFLGEKPEAHQGKVYLAHTLEETAKIAVDLAKGSEVKKNYLEPLDFSCENPLGDDKTVIGLYSGGTLANEAGMLISEALDLGGVVKEEGFILHSQGYDVIDLGDDIYTQGKPHPMIDPEVRIDYIKKYGAMGSTGVILFDCMLGYGCHPDMAAALAPVIKEQLEHAKATGRELYFVGSVTGTENDPQDYRKSFATLREAGAIMETSNARAIRLALEIKGIHFTEEDREVVPYKIKDPSPLPQPSEQVMELLNTTPRIINVGVESFNDSLRAYGAQSVQFSWRPLAGGNKRMIHLLNELEKIEGIDEANERICDRFKESQPFLVDIVPAKTVIPELAREQKTLLHAGPPIVWENMMGPMRGSCIGAALFEGWAETEEEALALLEAGEVEFIPCHHCHAVGPMGGITSANMAVLVVHNMADDTVAYCTMNEGIGKVLRFGAYSQEVVDRLHWMADELGPVLAKALKLKEGGINLSVLMARAITQGDEFHQRNMAASLNFLKEVAPLIIQTDADDAAKQRVIQFLADTDQFFLNVMMATGKAIVDYARKDKEGCIVSTMTRNGYDFGIRIAALGDEWFTAPVNTPIGLYFTGFTAEDGCPDNGDSAICETVGVGGMAMVAAPGVTRFVGAGGFEDALNISNEMERICVTHNPNWSIPTWDFKGTCLGIDIRKVVATGITPIINTGIAHREAGIGQVGAGTVRAPLACFEKALEAYCASLGIE